MDAARRLPFDGGKDAEPQWEALYQSAIAKKISAERKPC
jgi:hypothetical protein